MSDIEQVHAYANKLRAEADRYTLAALHDRRFRLLAEAARFKVAGQLAAAARSLTAAQNCTEFIDRFDRPVPVRAAGRARP